MIYENFMITAIQWHLNLALVVKSLSTIQTIYTCIYYYIVFLNNYFQCLIELNFNLIYFKRISTHKYINMWDHKPYRIKTLILISGTEVVTQVIRPVSIRDICFYYNCSHHVDKPTWRQHTVTWEYQLQKNKQMKIFRCSEI